MKGRNRARRETATGFNSLSASAKPRYQLIGPAEHVPRFNFKATAFFSSSVVRADKFNTKTNTNGSGQIIGATSNVGNAFAFSIGDIPEIEASTTAGYLALFDQFILLKVVLRIKSVGDSGNTTAPMLYVVCDFDNATLLTTLDQAEVYNNVQEVRSTSGAGYGESIVVTLKPCIGLATNAGNAIIGPQWQDCANSTNRHYGVKTFYLTTAVGDPKFDVDAQYHYGFRNKQ